MPRVKRGTVRRAKRKKLLGLAKGYYANKSKLYRAAKEDRRLHLVAVFQEALDMFLLELVIVLVDLRAKLDLLDLDHLLVLARLARPLLLLVLILPEIHDAADRRDRRGRNLDQVEPLLLRDGQRLRRRHDAELCAVVVDHPDFADADPFVDPHSIVASWTSVESDKYLLDQLSAFSLQLVARAMSR